MNYYYLAAILPTLTINEPPGMSVEQFKDLCAEHLTQRDCRAVDNLLAEESASSRHAFVREWQEMEDRLRNAVVKMRAVRLERDPAPFLKDDVPYDTTAERITAEAFARKAPLFREQALDDYRWQRIEEMAGLDPFTSRAILAYALKFKLCNRWAAMNRERGEDEANALINQEEQT